MALEMRARGRGPVRPGLFQDVGRAMGDGARSLDRLAGDHETPNGLNERVRTTWFGTANSEALAGTLLADLRRPG